MSNTKTRPDPRLRLFCEGDLGPDCAVVITSGQNHHLHTVLRARAGQQVLLFNGRDGEWLASIRATESRRTTLLTDHQTRPQAGLPDIWLVFSPLTRDRTHYAVEKATELGVARICPVTMTRTRPRRIVPERLQAVAIGAAQQCGGLAVPEISHPQPLDSLLAHWPAGRTLFHCDETLTDRPCDPYALAHAGPRAVLIGPEGGLDPGERAMLHDCDFTHPVSLGPRILRAETALVSALTLMNLLPSAALVGTPA